MVGAQKGVTPVFEPVKETDEDNISCGKIGP
jgi:hypothetical protein